MRLLTSMITLHCVFSLSMAMAASEKIKQATADIKNAQGETIGKAKFKQTKKGVQIDVEVSKLPEGTHAIHVHEAGKCEGPDFKSAGAHYTAQGKEHGLENPKGPHWGDLPNLEVKKNGKAKFKATTDRVSLAAGENSLLKEGGTSIVIHADADDQKSQPAGNAGGRIACGVLTAK